MSSELEVIWNDVTSGMPRPVSEWWWSLLLKKYTESGRNCHDLLSLQEKFHEFESVRGRIKNTTAFALAMFFQYFEYDTKDSDCHSKNIENFNKFGTEAAILDSEIFSQVKYLLEASAIHSTEEHKTEGAHGMDDLHYFLDIDMAVLGAQPDMYAYYIENVQAEYSFLEPSAYRNLRKRVLQTFLLIPNIFATKEFKDKYELNARANIENELKGLFTT